MGGTKLEEKCIQFYAYKHNKIIYFLKM